jgi:hypothetical protein
MISGRNVESFTASKLVSRALMSFSGLQWALWADYQPVDATGKALDRTHTYKALPPLQQSKVFKDKA